MPAPDRPAPDQAQSAEPQPTEPGSTEPEGAEPGSTQPKPGYHALDARSLRGLAHPLRMRLLASLRHDGPATASQLAARLHESSGATSYHLRQLAAHGFVADDPDRGTGRERWWKASVQGTHFSRELHESTDPEVRGAADLFLHEVATTHTQELSTWLGTLRDWPSEWAHVGDLSDYTLRLTPERLREMNKKLHEVVESYQEADADAGTDANAGTGGGTDSAPENSAQIRVHLHSFPRALPRD
ncbi:ArsR/SmtB family transcription factor [Streptomyces corynorhini]|uniref:ArsR family transcriptional regulator n=1 Tax=Streptomyces corynorhini TaxID=2282652 RepID=A0A370BDT9_9ACTN|nr:helix-turn-helix domain-containing protein [Streptomyces corynorhini]RDG37595.1 ArsR family transcriptional regulator [Streptomyces corynorhini]